MKLSERIKQFIAERAAKVAALEAVQEKALKDGRSKDKQEQEQFDELMGEIEAIDRELSDLRRMEKLAVVHATSVGPGDDDDDDEIEAGTHQRPKVKTVDGGGAVEGRGRVIAVGGRKLAKGILFARYVKCLGAARGDLANAMTLAKLHYSDTPQIAMVLKAGLSGGLLGDIMHKAAVAGGTTTDATWAGPLTAYVQFAGDFIEYLRPKTIIGQFGQANGNYGDYPSLRMVPFNVHIRGQTSGGQGYWVGQGKAKPLSKLDFNDTYLGWSKAAAISVLSEDLLRFSNPSAELLVRDALGEAIIGRLDIDFVDPTKIAVANVSPASITHGSTTTHSAGATAADCRQDIAVAMGGFIAANISPDSAVWIMQSTTALQLSLLRNAFGQKEFPEITLKGGILEGVPVITSQYVPNESGGAMMILANASDIWLADDGNVTIDASREASLEMSDAPANDASAPTAAQMVSMFQTNSVALRAERFINWQKRRAAAVQVIDDINYTGG
jgi:HK97 family phage major capsid protein